MAAKISEKYNTAAVVFTNEEIMHAAALALKSEGVMPDAVAGFSLGEIPALAFAGAYSYTDGFKAAIERGKAMGKAAEENPDSTLAKIYNRDGRMSGRLFFEALNENCPVANKVFDTYLDYLAVGIKSINMVFGPDAIVLAGGITKEGEKILKPLREKLPPDIRVEASTLQSDAGSLGAAML